MFAQTFLCVNVTFPCATKEFGVYIPPRALCCALGDPLDGAFLRRFGMTRYVAVRLTTGRREQAPALRDGGVLSCRATPSGVIS